MSEYLINERGILKKTMDKYGVTEWDGCVVFRYLDRNGEFHAKKYRKISEKMCWWKPKGIEVI